MKKIIVAVLLLFMMCLPAIGAAAEKRVSIKGLYIGMSVEEARTMMEKLLVGNWKLTGIGPVYKVLANYHFGNQDIFGLRSAEFTTGTLKHLNEYSTSSGGMKGDYGFAILRGDSYEGFITANQTTKAVTRISISGEVTEAIFNSDKNKKIDMEEFVVQFTGHFGLPDFNWIPYGWQYESPNGYTITLKTNRLIDIKLGTVFEPVKQAKINESKTNESKTKISFD